jgi:hypothetical protein
LGSGQGESDGHHGTDASGQVPHSSSSVRMDVPHSHY